MLFQSHSSATLLALAIFQKVKNFFRKYHVCFGRKTKFRTFWEILQIQSQSIANLQPLAIFKKSMFFSEEPNYFSEKTQILKILRNPTFPLAFYSKFASFSNFEKFMIFLERPIFFSIKNPKFQLWTFWKFMLFQSQSRAKLRPLAILRKIKIFLERRICFLLKNETFQLWTFRELLLFQSHSTAILLALDIFQNVKIFFEKTIYHLKKNPNFERCRESYQFSRILWQICYL